eukprot:3551178-Alexandrium_andersonii.AAC.1
MPSWRKRGQHAPRRDWRPRSGPGAPACGSRAPGGLACGREGLGGYLWGHPAFAKTSDASSMH